MVCIHNRLGQLSSLSLPGLRMLPKCAWGILPSFFPIYTIRFFSKKKRLGGKTRGDLLTKRGNSGKEHKRAA